MARLWTTDLNCSLLGSMDPAYDPKDDILYFSSGYDCPQAQAPCSLRAISLSNGELREPLSLRAHLFSVALDPGSGVALVPAGRRLVEVDRPSWSQTRVWTKRVPQHSHNALLCSRRAVLAGWAGPIISIFDLDSATCRRKRLGSCQALYLLPSNEVLVCSHELGNLFALDPLSGDSRFLVNLGPFIHSAHCPTADLLIAGLGVPVKRGGDYIEHFRHSKRLAVVPLRHPLTATELPAPITFTGLWATSDAGALFLAADSSVHHYRFTGTALTHVREIVCPPTTTPWVVLPDRGLLLAANSDTNAAKLSAISLS